jgi:hypothetical protein
MLTDADSCPVWSMDQTELSVHDAEVNDATGISVIHDVV